MAEKDNESQPAPEKTSLLASPVIPGAIAVVVFGLIIANMTGIITLPHVGDSCVYEITPPATIGHYRSIDFRDQLIPLLGPQEGIDPAIYTFYLGSNVGFPPMGLILGTDGILKGTPTGKGGTFQVCVRDEGGRSACRRYHLDVNEAEETTPATPALCPAELNPPCSLDGTPPVRGGKVPESCRCPGGTRDSGFIDRNNPATPFRICVCN
jgi:hypothetical protein